jgi:hypothetical protein
MFFPSSLEAILHFLGHFFLAAGLAVSEKCTPRIKGGPLIY